MAVIQEGGAEAPQSDSYDANGILEVSDDVLLTPDEMSDGEASDIGHEDTQNEHDDLFDDEATRGEEAETTEKQEEEPKEEDKEPEKEESPQEEEDSEPKLLAGKYESKEQLEEAFKELGGDPNNFETPEAMAEAYLVRQSEYTRVKQETALKERVEQEKTQVLQQRTEKIANTIKNVRETIDSKLNELDWTQVEDARDIGKLLASTMTPIITEAFMNTEPTITAAEAEQMEVRHKQELAVRGEINTLLDDVPRLNKDPAFADAFAIYVKGLKASNDYVSLKASMTKFLGGNTTKSTPESQTDNKKFSQGTGEIKAENNIPTKKSPEDAIFDDIISAQQEDRDKFGF